MSEEVELTEEELSSIEGRDVDPEEDVIHPGFEEPEAEAEAEEPVAAPVVEEPVQSEDEGLQQKLDKAEKANAGLLNDLIAQRKAGRADKDWRDTVEQRMDMLANVVAPEVQEEQKEEEPDRDDDPVAWLAWDQKRTIEKAMEPVRAKEEEERQVEEYNQLLERASEAATVAEKEFLEASGTTREDFTTALDELRFDRIKWYVASGLDVPRARAIVEQEEQQFVMSNLSENQNPAAAIMKMHSLVKPGPIPAPPDEGDKVTLPKPEAKKPLNAVTAARAGSEEIGLQNVGGTGTAGGTITAEQFAEMDQDDPIFQKIATSEKLFQQINVYGEVTL